MTIIEEPPERVVIEQKDDDLQPIGLGLGTASGYSGDDLTSPHLAVARGEVPYLHEGDPSHPVLELRIHGVGGAPPTDNLETPSVLQVAGDADAGFYRAWYPGGSAVGRPRVEAYCWGKLNTGSRWSALWPLLLPFGLVNLAYWALPETENRFGRWLQGALLRLLGLVLTGMFVGATAFLCLDAVAWQRAGSAKTWSWLRFYLGSGPGVRMAIAAVPVLAVIALLYALSRRTQGRYEEKQAGHGLDDAADWPLARRSFWQGSVPMARQRRAHMTLSGAVLITVLALPPSTAPALRGVALVVAAALAAWSIVVVALPWADRMTARPCSVTWSAAGGWDRTAVVAQAVALLGAIALAGARLGWAPRVRPGTAIPWDRTLQTSLALSALGLVVLLAVVVACARPWTAARIKGDGDRRAGDHPVMGLGFAGVGVAGLAATMSAMFGGTLTLTVANLLGQPVSYDRPSAHNASTPWLVVPPTVYASGFALIVTLAAAVMLVGALAVRRRTIAKRLLHGPGHDTVAHLYGDGRACQVAGTDTAARRAVAGTWATSRLTDDAALLLFGLVLPTAAAFVAYTGFLLAGGMSRPLSVLTGWGATLGVLATGSVIVFVRGAFSDMAKRKRFGFLWDVLTFWPRACHPFAPPCYAERTIPEVVTRIRRVVGDKVIEDDRGDPAVALQEAERCAGDMAGPREIQSPLLLVGYSQGCPIATAVVAQLPPEARAKVGLLTLASPVRRLYGRTFPAYFGAKHLETMRDDVLRGRWRNLVRESDYIGGYALGQPRASADPSHEAVDHMIWDPPVLWTLSDPAPPPTHRHSDWFPDPQTRPHAERLMHEVARPS